MSQTSLTGSKNNKQPKRALTHKELEKMVSDARLIVEELKADLKCVCSFLLHVIDSYSY